LKIKGFFQKFLILERNDHILEFCSINLNTDPFELTGSSEIGLRTIKYDPVVSFECMYIKGPTPTLACIALRESGEADLYFENTFVESITGNPIT